MAPSIDLSLVLRATGGTCTQRGAEKFCAAVIDGREVPNGALFFAIKGERFDGHDFVMQAVSGGADGVVVARGRKIEGVASATVIEVDDTAAALGKVARAYRESMTNLKVVAITGSNGKTTTKEMTASILGAQVGPDAVLKTEGNLNNHFGVPLTLLRLTEGHRYAVVEMGMSGLGEISYLQGLAKPDVAVVVCVAPVHLEQLGTIENIAKAKAEIWEGKPIAVAPVDEKLLRPYWPERVVTFGARTAGADVGVDDVQAGPQGVAFTLHLKDLTSRQGVNVLLPLVGAHNALDAAAAAAAARALDVGEGPIVEGLARVRPAKHRSQLVPAGDRVILDDCYNASPLSTKAALDALTSVSLDGHKTIAVLGDMLELGPESARLHAEIGAYAAERVDELIAFGPQSRHLAEAAKAKLGEHVLHTEDPSDAAEQVLEVSGKGDVILVKASRGMRLERVIEKLLERLGG